MPFGALADGLLLLHALFVVFVVAGGALALRWPGMAWVHLPAAAWGALIEFAGFVCPLTPLEQSWRRAAGDRSYEGGFIEHYVTAALYPPGLMRPVQIAFGIDRPRRERVDLPEGVEEIRVSKLLAWVGATLLGAVGWWAGARGGMFTAFVVSMVGTGAGLYLGRRLAAHLLD